MMAVSKGIFSFSHIATELKHRDLLDVFLTSYPRRRAVSSGAPADSTRGYPAVEILVRAGNRVPSNYLRDRLTLFARRRLAARACSHLAANPSVTHVIAGGLLGESLAERAHSVGAKFVVDRGAAHPRVQRDLLREAYAKYGEEYAGISDFLIEVMDREYEIADLLIVPSYFVKRSLLESGVNPHKISVVGRGVDFARFHNMNLTRTPGKVLQIGASIQKGALDAIDAVRMLEDTNIKLVIVGGVEPLVRDYLGARPTARVDLRGPISRERLSLEMNTASILLQPSIQDGFSVTAAQGAACGLPVIASTNCGFSDEIEDGVSGFIVPPGNPSVLAERIAFCTSDEDRRSEMGQRSELNARQRLSWGSVGDRMVAALLA